MKNTRQNIPKGNSSQQNQLNLMRNGSANQDGQSVNSSISNNSQNMHSVNFSQNSEFASLMSGIPDISNMDPRSMDENMIISLFQIVQQQTIALQSLMKKVQYMGRKAIQLNQKISVLKKPQDHPQHHHLGRGISDRIMMHDENKPNWNQPLQSNVKLEEEGNHHGLKQKCKASGLSQITDPQKLIQILFGSSQYQYKLQLDEPLKYPLFRQRNFEVKIKLVDMQGNQISNDNKIPLNIAVYTCQNPPKFVQTNTGGQKMIKGFTEQTLQNSYCRFEKIQIREVTSHFRNGWVFIVVMPSMTPLGSSNSSSKVFVDYKKVKPLVLDKVIVKAKKLKSASDKAIDDITGKNVKGKKKVGQAIKQEMNQSQSQFFMGQSQPEIESEKGFKNNIVRSQNSKFYEQQGES